MVDAILVWKDKHRDSYYNASTPEKLEESARIILQVLTSDYGYIQDPGTELSKWDLERLDMELVEMDESEYASLPEKLRLPIEHEKKKYAKLLNELKEQQEEYELACDLANGVLREEKFRRQEKYTDEQWKQILERFPDYPVRDGWMYRPVSAWSFLQNRSGYEYEDYSIESLEN